MCIVIDNRLSNGGTNLYFSTIASGSFLVADCFLDSRRNQRLHQLPQNAHQSKQLRRNSLLVLFQSGHHVRLRPYLRVDVSINLPVGGKEGPSHFVAHSA